MNRSSSRVLKATWSPGNHYGLHAPQKLIWDDGRTGTLAEFEQHEYSTRFYTESHHGNSMQLFIDLVVEARFEPLIGSWMVTGISTDPLTLSVSDPHAAEEDILWALQTGEIEYQLQIVRYNQ